jgi:hypothetical protein
MVQIIEEFIRKLFLQKRSDSTIAYLPKEITVLKTRTQLIEEGRGSCVVRHRVRQITNIH